MRRPGLQPNQTKNCQSNTLGSFQNLQTMANIVTTSKALVTTSDALVSSSVLSIANHGKMWGLGFPELERCKYVRLRVMF